MEKLLKESLTYIRDQVFLMEVTLKIQSVFMLMVFSTCITLVMLEY